MSNTLDNNQPNSEPTVSDSDAEPEPTGSDLKVAILVDPDLDCVLAEDRYVAAAIAAAAARGYTRGEIGIRITDDRTIRELNARHLGHDYETDVISFAYECQDQTLVGELVTSWDTARKRAQELGWTTDEELMLYIVHGVLHITGMDDHDAVDRAAMRQQEQAVMLQLGVDQIVRLGADAVNLSSVNPTTPNSDPEVTS